MLTIGGHRYYNDVLITPYGVRENWWRNECHLLAACDLYELIALRVGLVIVGTGFEDRLVIPAETREFLEQHKVELQDYPTPRACIVYNDYIQRVRTFAALHLTC